MTEEDLIGAYDSVTGKETGLEVLRQVYPRFGIAPGFLLAPGWSENRISARHCRENVRISMAYSGACACWILIQPRHRNILIVKVKEESGYSDPHAVVVMAETYQRRQGVRIFCGVWSDGLQQYHLRTMTCRTSIRPIKR